MMSLKRILNKVLDIIKFVVMFVAAMFIGIISWWPVIAIGIIICCLISFFSVAAACVLFSILSIFAVLLVLGQIFS